jgi:hypothetical protein
MKLFHRQLFNGIISPALILLLATLVLWMENFSALEETRSANDSDAAKLSVDYFRGKKGVHKPSNPSIAVMFSLDHLYFHFFKACKNEDK